MSPMDTSQFTLLIVDDTPSLRDLLEASIELQGYQVITAENGLEAMEMLNTKPFDLVLLDIVMPVMDGVDTFAALRKADPHVRVLLSSGYSKDEKIEILLSIIADFNEVVLAFAVFE